MPLPPAELEASRDQATGAVHLRWRRRNRLDRNGGQSFESPLDHAPEAYRLTIRQGSAVLRVVECVTPSWSYDLPSQTADWGGPAGMFEFSICQLSAVLGEGHKAEGMFSG